MQRLLEKGILLQRNEKWYMRVLGGAVMFPAILTAKWLEYRAER